MKYISIFIAWRYVWAKKSMHSVHIIMWSSILSVVVGVATLFIILGIYNGMSETTYKQFRLACPDIALQSQAGQAYFDGSLFDDIDQSIDNILVSSVLEKEVLITVKSKKTLVRLVGVDSFFSHVVGLQAYTQKQIWNVGTAHFPLLIISSRAANQLLIDPDRLEEPIVLSAVVTQKGVRSSLSLLSQLHSDYAKSFTTYYEIGNDLNSLPVIYTNIDFVRSLTNAPLSQLSSIYISGVEEDDISSVKKMIEAKYPSVKALNREEQNETYFAIFSAEKKMLLVVIFFMLIVSMTGSIGALRILFLEKVVFSKILYSIGYSFAQIKRIFLYQSLIINLTGLVIGLLCGGLFLVGQHYFEWLTIEGATYSIPYTISISATDIALVVISVFVLNLLGILLAMSGIKKRIVSGMITRF